jgi:hypothetical protein
MFCGEQSCHCYTAADGPVKLVGKKHLPHILNILFYSQQPIGHTGRKKQDRQKLAEYFCKCIIR